MTKRISPKQYAEAFFETTTEKKVSHEKAIEHLMVLLHKNGDWIKRRAILDAYQTLVRKRGGSELVIIESARPLTKEQHTEIENIFHGKKIDLEEHTNPELIAGIKIVIDREKQFDGTLKRKLDEILENIE